MTDSSIPMYAVLIETITKTDVCYSHLAFLTFSKEEALKAHKTMLKRMKDEKTETSTLSTVRICPTQTFEQWERLYPNDICNIVGEDKLRTSFTHL